MNLCSFTAALQLHMASDTSFPIFDIHHGNRCALHMLAGGIHQHALGSRDCYWRDPSLLNQLQRSDAGSEGGSVTGNRGKHHAWRKGQPIDEILCQDGSLDDAFHRDTWFLWDLSAGLMVSV
jgi:hypothetical protein